MDEIRVTEGDRVLSRVVTGESFAELAPLVEVYRSVYIIYDAVLEWLVVEKIEPVISMSDIFGRRFKGRFAVKVSEDDKSMDTVLGICRWLLEGNADRDVLLLAVGGGITTDMAGFAASIYKRGIHFAYVPTTLLAQVDAAVGGKTGVNFGGYKNILGVINQPDFTFICPDVLESLPYRDFLSGCAELLKTFVIEDNGNYEEAVKVLSDIHSRVDKAVAIWEHRGRLMELIHAAVAVKAGIVSRDRLDFGERKKLNLGHTFAHAIEHCARIDGVDITHGEAVAMGIVLAAGLSGEKGLCAAGLQERIRRDFEACGLPVDCPFSLDRMKDAFVKDKKNEGGKQVLVLVRGVGDVVVWSE